MIKIIIGSIVISCVMMACNTSNTKDMNMQQGTFAYDVDFLKQYHPDLIELGEGDARLVVLPAYQGRIMTSTAEGDSGLSFGWINHELIASGKFTDHFSAFGGEERFWLGPEGGQFSVYFKKGKDFVFDNWKVPEEIDTRPFDLVRADNSSAVFVKHMQLENYSGTVFNLKVDRTIRLLDDSTINAHLHLLPAGVKAVAFESENVLTNEGKTAWDKTSGMLSIWILSMMNASDSTTIFMPYKQGDSTQLGKIVTDDYFGKVPASRLMVGDGLIRFKADGHYRSKIGLSPRRALPIAASYDAANGVLTLAQYTLGGSTEYVNSLWEMQQDPFSGDAVNAYNDGPIDGKQMGNFYEIESSSPAAALTPGQSLTHVHRTFHIKGNPEQLNLVVMKLLGIGLDKVILE
ncbi:MAG: hypothetical protein RLZZ420_1675 [Bacteroidota bacterium]|jgi:hypothetical protein